MRKIIVLIVVLCLILSACQSSMVAQSASLESNQNEPLQMHDKAVEIEFWHALGGSLGDGLNEIVEDFNQSQNAYVVNPVVIGSYSEIDEKLLAAYAADITPALVAGGSFEKFYTKGLVVPFEDYMPADYDKTDIVKGFLKAALMKNKMYFAPAYGTSQVLYYNKKVLKAADKTVEDLATWQSLASLAKDIDLDYVWEPMWGTGNIADMAYTNGGRYLSKDGKTVTINSKEWVEVLEQVRKWLHEDKIMRIHSGGQGWEYWYKTMDDWVYGKSLGYTGSPGDYIIALDAVKKAIAEGHDNEFAVTHQPGWKSNAPSPMFYSLMYFIPKSNGISEEQKKGAATFITFATNTKNTAKFAMATGYVAVRNSVLELPEYKEYLSLNPDADVALKQIDQYAVPEFVDPTGGAIIDALAEAVDSVEIENKPVQAALDVAQKKAQSELDNANK